MWLHGAKRQLEFKRTQSDHATETVRATRLDCRRARNFSLCWHLHLHRPSTQSVRSQSVCAQSVCSQSVCSQSVRSQSVRSQSVRRPAVTARPPRLRLDQVLVERGLVPTRARARDLILRGLVTVQARTASKPAQSVGPGDDVRVMAANVDYVSRGALKLAAALAHFSFEAQGRIGLDIGASTGGFTETLLAAGARRVYAVDNGRGQLHAKLLRDARVVSLEGLDARRLDETLIPEPVEALVADVSFISLAKALPAALTLAAPGCWLAALIKPQVELAPGAGPRDGIIKDAAVQTAVVTGIVDWLSGLPDWDVVGCIPSPIHGGDGNIEFLIGAVRGA